jgi:hypothetical protein
MLPGHDAAGRAPHLEARAAIRASRHSRARKLGPFDHDLLEDLQRIEAKRLDAGADAQARRRRGNAARRVAAAASIWFLGAISAAVVWFTFVSAT